MREHLIRLARLKAYQKAQGWSDSELARQVGRSPQQIRSWSTTRRIGEELARDIETKLKLHPYFLDDRSDVIAGASLAETRSQSDGLITSRNIASIEARSFPLLAWEQLPTMLETENPAISASAPHLDSHAIASVRAKFVEMNDDSMAPNIMRGDHVLVDPTEVPRAGDVILVRLPSNEHFVRVFRPKTAYIFEAFAVNQHYQPLNSADDGASVAGVMIEHRSYRRRV